MLQLPDLLACMMCSVHAATSESDTVSTDPESDVDLSAPLLIQ